MGSPKNYKKKKQKLLDEHHDLIQEIALLAVRIDAMKRTLSAQSDKLFGVEAQIEKLDAEQKGSGLN